MRRFYKEDIHLRIAYLILSAKKNVHKRKISTIPQNKSICKKLNHPISEYIPDGISVWRLQLTFAN